jgi:hypothetical protein
LAAPLRPLLERGMDLVGKVANKNVPHAFIMLASGEVRNDPGGVRFVPRTGGTSGLSR